MIKFRMGNMKLDELRIELENRDRNEHNNNS